MKSSNSFHIQNNRVSGRYGVNFGAHVAVILFVLISVARVQTCTREERCLGGRPHTPNGCCPVAGGDDCGVEVGVQCDSDLGYRCLDVHGNVTTQHGLCTGRYHVNVTNIGSNTVTLEWDDFKPENYYFEYVLLFRKDPYTNDTSAWTLWDIGTEPRYTMTKLSAYTLYFMRLAVWEDARATVLGNMSEVIWVVTQSVSHCIHNGEQYEVGNVMENCEDRCTCMGTGRMDCTPQCPESSLPHVPLGCSLVFQDECSCNVTVTCPDGQESTTSTSRSAGSCVYKGHSYSDGATWTDTTDCTMCTCEEGHVSCQMTCGEPEVPEGCVNPRQQIEASGCCPEIVCDSTVPAGREEECNLDGAVYHIGDSFTSNCSLCMCVQQNQTNCTFNTCPVLEIPVASILCPNPHVRSDGCCDTVFCFQRDPDPQALLSRLMALSFGPDSLTISFDVDHATSVDTVTQERYEVMTSDSESEVPSWISRTYTPRTVNADDNISSPSDLLHADAAIRVDRRVFITLDGLNPNTTYYVRVEPMMKRDMGVTGSPSRNTTLIGFFVARTMSQEMKCLVGDVAYNDGAVVSDDCEEVCKCMSGEVRCQKACPEEQLVMVPSPSCPRPQLVASPHSCCRTWKCFPEEGGCFYEDTILKNGEQVYDGLCDRKCRCTESEVRCTPVCPAVLPAPRFGCTLTNITHTCCPVWMCPLETEAPVGMSLASQIGFHGVCSEEDTFQSSLKKAFASRVEGQLPCSDRESHHFVQCWLEDIVVKCPPLDTYRKRRQTPQIQIIAVFAANITELNTDIKIQKSFNTTGNALSAMFSSAGVQLLLDNGVNVTSSGSFHIFGVSHICESGFVYRRNVCVREYTFQPSSTPQQRQKVSMTVIDISQQSASFVWPILSQNALTYVTGLVIEYRVTSSLQWNRTMRLEAVTTNHTVGHLHASQHYVARLVALTNSTSASRVILSSVPFTTANSEVLTGALTFDPLRVSLDQTSVTISWRTPTKDVTSAIVSLKITCRRSQDVDDIISRDLDPHVSRVTLTGLKPGTAYVSKFLVVLVNGSTMTMPPLHFVTKAKEASSMPLVPLLATCAGLILLSILVPIIFLVWRRTRRKVVLETAFENKTYGVNITSLCTNRAKNDGARPQDTENGNVVASSTGAGDCPLQQP